MTTIKRFKYVIPLTAVFVLTSLYAIKIKAQTDTNNVLCVFNQTTDGSKVQFSWGPAGFPTRFFSSTESPFCIQTKLTSGPISVYSNKFVNYGQDLCNINYLTFSSAVNTIRVYVSGTNSGGYKCAVDPSTAVGS